MRNNRFPRFTIGKLGRTTLWSAAGLCCRALIQAGYLIVLSRSMGVSGYGAFAGAVALVMLLSPLSGWGISYLLTQKLISSPTRYRELFISALIQIFLSGCLLLLASFLLAMVFLDAKISFYSLLLLGISELFLLPAALIAMNFSLVSENGRVAAITMCVIPFGRLIAVVVPAIFFGRSLDFKYVCELHFYGSIVGFLFSFLLVVKMVGLPLRYSYSDSINLFAGSGRYAVGSLVTSNYLEVDKILILQVLGSAALGSYSVAFRVASVCVMPIAALMSSILPRFFALSDPIKILKLAKLAVMTTVLYGVLVCVGVLLVAPLLPKVFGSDFYSAVSLLMLFSVWPLFYAIRNIAATALTGIGLQRVRIFAELIGLILIIVLNLTLLPQLGARAAVYSLLVSEIFVGVACSAFFYMKLNQRGA
jgi:O-antigen/teichoic acid export membrane protein